MDLVKRHPLPPQLTAKAESWLQYYRDIGIRSFYKDRSRHDASVHGVLEASVPSRKNTPANQEAASAPFPTRVPAPTPAPAQRTPPSPGGAAGEPRLQGIAPGPSLFEAAARIEGDSLEHISADIGECTRCKLHRGRNKIVFGTGNPRAELMFVGEGPGHDEDIQGLPFVGRAGKLLTQMIEAMGLRREDVYIANVVKCRPPDNRAPEKDEEATCIPFLIRQISAIEPKVIVCLGNVAMQALLGKNKGISHHRGQWFDFRGARLIPTYHPAYLLRNPHAKSDVWVDLKKVMALLGLKAPRPGQRGKTV